MRNAGKEKNYLCAVMRTALFLALSMVLLAGCDNELDVTADWKDIPIVYGILSPQDTVHYVRIEKAFLDPTIPANEIARIPDSLYYENVDAAIVDLSTGLRYQFEEVNGEDEGIPRDEGIFAESPNILYRIDADDLNLTGGRQYRFELNRSERLPLVEATIEQVRRGIVTRPVENTQLRFPYEGTFSVVWREADNAFFYDVSLIVRYEEANLDDPGSAVSKTAEWKLARNTSDVRADVFGIEFYQFLADELEADPRIIRRLDAVDCYLRSGGRELFDFRTIQNANSGFTSVGGDIPQYTNLSEGLGIITTSNRDQVLDLQLSNESLDSLINGSITGDLNFR